MAIITKRLADALKISTEGITALEKGEYQIEDDRIVKSLMENYVSRETAIDDGTLLAAFKGKILGSLDAKVKRLGSLTPDDTKDIKSTDDLIELAIKKARRESEAFMKSNTDDKIKQAEARATQSEELAKALELKVQEAETSKQQFVKDFKVDTRITELISSLKLKPKNREFALQTLKNGIKSGYKLEINDKGDLDIQTPDGLKIKNSDQTRYLTPKEVIEKMASDAEWLELSGSNSQANGNGQAAVGTKVAGDSQPTINGRKLTSSEQAIFDKATKHAESLKAAASEKAS